MTDTTDNTRFKEEPDLARAELSSVAMSSEGDTYLDLRPGIDAPQVRRSKVAHEAMESNASVALNVAAPSRRASRLPKQVQFPLIVILSFSMSSLGYSMLNEGTKGELAAIAKAPELKYQVALLAAWRMYVSTS